MRCPPSQFMFFCAMSPPMKFGAFSTLGSVLDCKQSGESGKFQLVSSIVSLAQLVSPSVALLAELVISILSLVRNISSVYVAMSDIL